MLLGALCYVHRAGMRWTPMADAPGLSLTGTYGLALGAVALVWLAPASRRRAVLVAISVLAYALVLKTGTWAIAALVLALCGIGRLPIKVRYQIALALAAWAALPVTRFLLWPAQWQHSTFTLSVIWAGLAYSALFLLVERQRRALRGRITLIDEVFYLTALPRLVEPFFQPISPRYLFDQQVERFDSRLALRALGLGLWGLLLALVAGHLRTWHPPITLVPLRLAIDYLGYYATAAHQIFISMALFRLLGFDLASGFRWPLISRSFADFFRRWNHYVRDAVLSLFFYPFLGRLRLSLPKAAATIVAAYAAIFFGSFVMNDLLVPAVTSIDPIEGARRSLDPQRLVALFVLWSAIILPRLGLTPSPQRARPGRWRHIAHVVRFLLLYLLIWGGSWWLRTQRTPPSWLSPSM